MDMPPEQPHRPVPPGFAEPTTGVGPAGPGHPAEPSGSASAEPAGGTVPTGSAQPTEPSEPAAGVVPVGAAEPSERERELAALAQMQADLADVDRALERIDDGSYGTCEACGEGIPDEVLGRAPVTRLCGAHAA